MSYSSATEYQDLVTILTVKYNVSSNITDSLLGYLDSIERSEIEKQFSTPMKWIGMYIALASLVCIIAMVADLVHGFRSKKLWFPCKYFRVNAAFLTVISVAMKLPLDLTDPMYGDADIAAKFGSMAFMCTMMANLLPCLATMNNNDLLSNIIALCVLVITLVVNVCIQIQTGAISNFTYYGEAPAFSLNDSDNSLLPSVYVALLLVLLVLHVCSTVAILKTKKIIETKYQQGHDRATKDLDQSSAGQMLTVEKLKKHVSNHWIMAGSGSPQFITACLHTTSASGVICLFITISHTYTMVRTIHDLIVYDGEYDSDYGWSMIAIVVVQYIGVVIGTIAPLSRCFATLSFKVSSKIISNHFKFFEVESYWTRKLYDWKHSSVSVPFCSHNLEVITETSKRLVLNICIGFQNGIVVVCKVISLIPFLFMICFLYCIRLTKRLLKVLFSSLGNKVGKMEGNNELRPYVLQLKDELELGDRTLKGLSKSVNRLIQKGVKSQPENLMKLILGKSTSGFEGVKKFDQIDLDVPSNDCWRLAVVTLTTIAVSLPKIEKGELDNLLESVKEGLIYVIVVEKGLNDKDDHVSFQKAAETQWQEIRFDKNWLGNQLQDPDFQVRTANQIVEWFRDKAKNIVSSAENSNDNTGGDNDESRRISICATSMYRITETIMLTYHTNNAAMVCQEELFDSLSSMIADIITACPTNLPQAIAMKCHTSVIEERESSVYDAAKLLGETTQIIETLRGRNIPNMDPSDMPFIEKWRAYLGNP